MDDTNLLVGLETSDDAAVYRINDETALVLTADFITPPVDDPYLFGQIAATNAISDVYAMGGKPLVCLNLVGFPSNKLPASHLDKIMSGALSKILESGAVLGGGHSTEDDEPKFGLSVTGIVHPDKIWRNSSAKAGDKLILTKPIGSGVLINASRKNMVPKKDLDECIALISTLNRIAAETLANFSVHAATDVTGFGMAGHSYEMAKGAGLTFRLHSGAVPVMASTYDMYRKGVTTGVNKSNEDLVSCHIQKNTPLKPWELETFFDPQTAGGLLVALPAKEVEPALKALHQAGVSHAVEVGEVLPKEESYLILD